jgi:5-methyltetrahydropteroyltriglutamate--homocysteine methyltransferase
MKRSEDRILTTHVGSIVRPKALLDLAGYKLGPPKDPAHYGVVLRAAVAEVVQRQAHAGIDIVNDGEYGKSSWANYVVERMTGFEARPDRPSPLDWLGRDRERFPEVVEQEFGKMPSSAGPEEPAALPSVGGASRRGFEPRLTRYPGGPGPISRLFR